MDTAKAIQLLHRLQDEQFDGIHGDERREALEMAVRALESNLVKESGDLVQDLVNDCISRKMAIEAFEPEHDTDWYTPRIIEVLEALPPVQPQWIPCSKRLPEEFGEYLITKNRIGWNFEEYNSNDIAYFDNEGFHKADKVLAWMPLPEPYGGESDV